MSKCSSENHTSALDKTCKLAEYSASVYASLSELAMDTEIATQLLTCARTRSQAANDLIVARQQRDELVPARQARENEPQLKAMRLDNLVGDTAAMYHSLREMDLEVRDVAQIALQNESDATVIEPLQSLVLALEEASQALNAMV